MTPRACPGVAVIAVAAVLTLSPGHGVAAEAQGATPASEQGANPQAPGNAPPAPLDPVVNKPRVYTFVLDGKIPLPNGGVRP